MRSIKIGILTLALLVLVGCSSFSVYQQATNQQGQTDLMRAIYFQDVNKIKQLVEKGIDTTTTDTNGANVLHYAARYGNEEIASYLLEQPTIRELQTKPGGIRNNLPIQEARQTVTNSLFVNPCL